MVGDYYVFNVDSYRKARFHKYTDDFRERLVDYYYASKKYYLIRELKYSRFVTILRHICNHINIPFTTRIHYANNTYYITYYIKSINEASGSLSETAASPPGAALPETAPDACGPAFADHHVAGGGTT